jgi:hypothetical protein
MCKKADPDDGDIDFELERRIRAHRLALGFKPGEPIHKFAHTFSAEEIMRSLFGSSYARAVPIEIMNADGSLRLSVVITRAEVRYERRGRRPAESNEEKPGWYLEGWVLKSGFDMFDGMVRVRIVWEDLASNIVLWQVIPDHPDPEDLDDLIDG